MTNDPTTRISITLKNTGTYVSWKKLKQSKIPIDLEKEEEVVSEPEPKSKQTKKVDVRFAWISFKVEDDYDCGDDFIDDSEFANVNEKSSRDVEDFFVWRGPMSSKSEK